MVYIEFPDDKKFTVDSYSYSKYGGGIVLRAYNPASYEEKINYVKQCDFTSFDLRAEYPGSKQKNYHFVSYELDNCFISFKGSGVVLEFYLNKMEVL